MTHRVSNDELGLSNDLAFNNVDQQDRLAQVAADGSFTLKLNCEDNVIVDLAGTNAVEFGGEFVRFIVMQYISAESLQSRLDREGPLDLCEVLRIGMQVADGLAAAHQQGLVHRDIKPSNILLEEEVDRALKRTGPTSIPSSRNTLDENRTRRHLPVVRVDAHSRRTDDHLGKPDRDRR